MGLVAVVAAAFLLLLQAAPGRAEAFPIGRESSPREAPPTSPVRLASFGCALPAYVTIGAGGAAGAWVVIFRPRFSPSDARKDPELAAIAAKIVSRASTLLPGALVVYFSFNAGVLPRAAGPRRRPVRAAPRGAAAVGAGSCGSLRTGLIAVFAAYAEWVLASGLCSGVPERAFIAVDYVLVYGLGFALFATSVRDSTDVRWVIRGLALGASAVCLFAFLNRVLPTVWSAAAGQDTQRLSYPLTYWNALGLLAALGIILCVGLTGDDREPRVVKALSAMALPVLGVTLLFTFSRGPIFACGVGLATYLVLGRPRSLLSAGVVVGPTVAISVIAAYRATSLAQVVNGTAIRASQGHHVARVVGSARWLPASAV